MKRIIFLALMCIASVICFISCNNSLEEAGRIASMDEPAETFDSAAIKEEVVSVQNQIESIYTNMEISETVQTRGWLSWVTKIVAVVISDAATGIVGTGVSGNAYVGYGCAIAASAFVASVPVENFDFFGGFNSPANSNGGLLEMNDEDTALPFTLPNESITGFANTFADSIGYYHNLVIMNMAESISSQDSITSDFIINLTVNQLNQYFDFNVSEVQSSISSETALFSFLEENSVNFANCNSISEIFNIWKSHFRSKTDELSLLESFMNGLMVMKVSNNNGDYMSIVLAAISQSNLPLSMKESLYRAFIVGNASYQLWNTEEEL